MEVRDQEVHGPCGKRCLLKHSHQVIRKDYRSLKDTADSVETDVESQRRPQHTVRKIGIGTLPLDPPAITSLSLQRCGFYSKDSTESGCLGKEDKMPTIVVRELQRGRQWKMDGALRRRLNAGYPRDRLRNRHMRESLMNLR